MAPNYVQNPPFSLTMKNVELVKPFLSPPSETLSLSSIDNNPNIEYHFQSIYVYRSNTTISSDPTSVLKRGLSRALVYYYPLAGKLKRQADGTLRITCNNHGVPFVEATVDCTLESLNYLEQIDSKTAKSFVYNNGPNDTDQYGYHPLLFQVTKFSCGGFTIGMSLSHSMCDGFGAAQFFHAVAELTSGTKSEPTVKPVWERERLSVEMDSSLVQNLQLPDMASLTTSPFLPTTTDQLCHEFFDINTESIQQLKTSSISEMPGSSPPFTTIEILGAYVWRSRFRALKQNPDGKTSLHILMNIRNLVNPPLPDGYYGNAAVLTSVVLSGNDLDKWPLSRVATMIKKTKKNASQTDQILASLNFLEASRRRNVKIVDNGASLFLTDWRQLKLIDDVDFGWKDQVNFVQVPSDMPESVSFCSFSHANKMNPSMRDGVRVLVSLPGPAMAVFKQEMDALSLQT